MPGTPGRSGGHNRRSSRRKALLGTYRPGRAGKGTPLTSARPVRPAWLTDEIALAAWDRICNLLEERETLSEGDADAVLLAAVAEAEYRQADALIVAQGIITTGRYGPQPHPATKIRESAWKRWSAALSRLGLDPITRARVEKALTPARDNPFLEWVRD